MKTLSCPSCNTANSAEAADCTNCGASLSAVKFAQNMSEIKELTEKLKAMNAPRKSFNSFNGCGTMLLDYRALPDGTFEATRWVTVFFLPLVPLSAYVIEPTSQEFGYGRETSKFSIIDKAPLSIVRILRTYLLVVVALAPIIVGSLNSSIINRTLGGPLAALAMLASIAWGGYIMFFKLKNDSKAYKRKAAAQE